MRLNLLQLLSSRQLDVLFKNVQAEIATNANQIATAAKKAVHVATAKNANQIVTVAKKAAHAETVKNAKQHLRLTNALPTNAVKTTNVLKKDVRLKNQNSFLV